MNDDDNYYRRRTEEELAAADCCGDPGIAQIHQEMARRYRDLLDTKLQLMTEAQVGGGPVVDTGTLIG